MRILVTGATGFIGRHICARLLSAGHGVVAPVRDPAGAARRFPGIATARIDMNAMTTVGHWLPLLEGVDGVVNCAGILQDGRGQSSQAIHADAPKALFDACRRAGVSRIVQISAISADSAAGTGYALTKKAADDHLRELPLDWVVLRPSLVYGQGSHGGTSLMRGLAGLPFFMPVVADGGQLFQPIAVEDLAESVLRALEDPALARRTLEPVGPDTLELRRILAMTRAWLGLPPARLIRVPENWARRLARLGDLLGTGPFRTTALDQLAYGNISKVSGFPEVIGFEPRRMAEAFARAPSNIQDRWHARLYFLRPVLTAALVLLWLLSGLAGLVETQAAGAIAERLGLSPGGARHAAIAFSLVDIAIAFALASGRANRLLGPVQLILVGLYTIGLGLLEPSLWLDPLGRLAKNLPILAAIAIWMALAEEG